MGAQRPHQRPRLAAFHRSRPRFEPGQKITLVIVSTAVGQRTRSPLIRSRTFLVCREATDKEKAPGFNPAKSGEKIEGLLALAQRSHCLGENASSRSTTSANLKLPPTSNFRPNFHISQPQTSANLKLPPTSNFRQPQKTVQPGSPHSKKQTPPKPERPTSSCQASVLSNPRDLVWEKQPLPPANRRVARLARWRQARPPGRRVPHGIVAPRAPSILAVHAAPGNPHAASSDSSRSTSYSTRRIVAVSPSTSAYDARASPSNGNPTLPAFTPPDRRPAAAPPAHAYAHTRPPSHPADHTSPPAPPRSPQSQAPASSPPAAHAPPPDFLPSARPANRPATPAAPPPAPPVSPPHSPESPPTKSPGREARPPGRPVLQTPRAPPAGRASRPRSPATPRHPSARTRSSTSTGRAPPSARSPPWTTRSGAADRRSRSTASSAVRFP